MDYLFKVTTNLPVRNQPKYLKPLPTSSNGVAVLHLLDCEGLPQCLTGGQPLSSEKMTYSGYVYILGSLISYVVYYIVITHNYLGGLGFPQRILYEIYQSLLYVPGSSSIFLQQKTEGPKQKSH